MSDSACQGPKFAFCSGRFPLDFCTSCWKRKEDHPGMFYTHCSTVNLFEIDHVLVCKSWECIQKARRNSVAWSWRTIEECLREYGWDSICKGNFFKAREIFKKKTLTRKDERDCRKCMEFIFSPEEQPQRKKSTVPGKYIARI